MLNSRLSGNYSSLTQQRYKSLTVRRILSANGYFYSTKSRLFSVKPNLLYLHISFTSLLLEVERMRNLNNVYLNESVSNLISIWGLMRSYRML